VFRRAPRRFDAVLELLANDPMLERLEAERQEFGMTHAEVGAAALSVMRFPADMVEAIGSHHTPPASITSHMGRVLVAADAVSLELDHISSEHNVPIGDALEALDIPAGASDALLEEVRKDQENLAGFLTVR
jgi:HD-like signal output (HDOD) protein